LKGEEVFVGREREIGQFFEFLKRKNWSAFVVIGEPGMGKSSFMKEVARRLMGDERFVVGFYEVPFSADIANPFVGVLEALVDDLAARTKEQVRSGLKRFAEAGKKVATKNSKRSWTKPVRFILSQVSLFESIGASLSMILRNFSESWLRSFLKKSLCC